MKGLFSQPHRLERVFMPLLQSLQSLQSLRSLVVILVVAVAVYGCSGDSSDASSTTSTVNSDGAANSGGGDDNGSDEDGSEVVLPPPPGPENDLTLEGIDSDADGIRDDVQRYLTETYRNTPSILSSFERLARIDQRLMSNSSNKEEVIRLYREKKISIACYVRSFRAPFERNSASAAYREKLYSTADRIRARADLEKYIHESEQYRQRVPCDDG